jgi:membrane-associated protein
MLHWLDSLLPRLPHYGYALVFVIVFLNNVGFPLPGETILLGAGFVLGRAAGSLWEPMLAGTSACFLGGICAFSLGRLEWPQRFFKRHGAKTVFIARFIALFPPVAANLLAGMTKMPWPHFLLFNLTGSAAYSIVYILIGYFFGKKWKLLQAWLGPTVLYVILAGITLIVLGIIFRHTLSRYAARLSSKGGK